MSCVSVADQEADGSALVFESRYEVPGLLGDPGPDRVGSHASQEDLATVQVDEEQDIDATEQDRVDVKEVAGKGAGRLGPQELRPRWARGPGRRV
jgi:hypothetical protein